MATRIEGTSSIRVLLDSISTRSFVKQFLKIHREARLKLRQKEEQDERVDTYLFPFFEELLLDVFSHKKLFGLNARTLCDSVRD